MVITVHGMVTTSCQAGEKIGSSTVTINNNVCIQPNTQNSQTGVTLKNGLLHVICIGVNLIFLQFISNDINRTSSNLHFNVQCMA